MGKCTQTTCKSTLSKKSLVSSLATLFSMLCFEKEATDTSDWIHGNLNQITGYSFNVSSELCCVSGL